MKPGAAAARVVRLADGSLLNRYYDDRDDARDESYREDTALADATPGRDRRQLFRRWFGRLSVRVSVRVAVGVAVGVSVRVAGA